MSGALENTDLCEVSNNELAWRRGFLERVIAHAGAGTVVHGEIAAALAEVTAEQLNRATAYAMCPNTPYLSMLLRLSLHRPGRDRRPSRRVLGR